MRPHTTNLTDAATDRIRTARDMVCASLPHLSGLAHTVRVSVDDRVPTAGITATGRLLVNPKWFAGLDLPDATFVMAHELMHLCLQTHARAPGTDPETFNWAHDYIINDMLSVELDRPPPAGGLFYPGARDLSAEKLVVMMRSGQVPAPGDAPRSDMRAALEEASLLKSSRNRSGPGTGDVIDTEQERELFPDADDRRIRTHRDVVALAAAKALCLSRLKDRVEKQAAVATFDKDPGDSSAIVRAVRARYAPPWELALQTWMETVCPGARSYVRACRRQASQPGIVLPGRTRTGFTLHIVLDTSGSMAQEIAAVLGMIASFCESVGVQLVHILQCDKQVTVDEFVEPESLASYRVEGFGGSDMSPAMAALAGDPEVEAVIVITDGCIDYPTDPPPYRVLWAVTDDVSAGDWNPGYGSICWIPRQIQ